MALTAALLDCVWEQDTVTGTGTVSLGGSAPTGGYFTFGAVHTSGLLANGRLVPYRIHDTVTDATEWGIGTFATGTPNTLARTLPLGGSNGAAHYNFAGNLCDLTISNIGEIVLAPRLTWQTGNWYGGREVLDGGITQFTPSASLLYATPIFPPGAMSAPASIGISVGTAPTTSTSVRLGIYADAGGLPGALLLDAGSISIAAVGIFSASVASAALFTGAPIWRVMGTPSALNSMQIWGYAYNGPAGAYDFGYGSAAGPANSGGTNLQNVVTGSFTTFGALPATFPTASYGAGSYVPAIEFQM